LKQLRSKGKYTIYLETNNSLLCLQAELHCKLTPREREYFTLFVSGLSQKEIAFAMAVSPQTVSSYKTSVMRKVGVKTNMIPLANSAR
jgi:DNA-binding CsgD family transcriptional regulator